MVAATKKPKKGKVFRDGSIGTILDVLAGSALAEDLREPPVERQLGGRGRGLRGLGRRCPVVHRVRLDRMRGMLGVGVGARRHEAKRDRWLAGFPDE